MRELAGVVLLVIMAGCGGGREPAGNVSPTVEPQRQLTLDLLLTFDEDDPIRCSFRRTRLAERRVTIRDAAGAILATTVVGSPRSVETPTGVLGIGRTCSGEATVRALVPRSDFYQVEVEGAAEQPGPLSDLEAVTRRSLTARGFTF